MTAPARARHGPILRSDPIARIGAAIALTVLAAIGVFVLIFDAAAVRTAWGLGPRLTGAATVIVRAHELESADAAAARAGEILSSAPGVATVSPLDPDPSDQIVALLLGVPRADASDVRLLAIGSHTSDAGFAGGLERRLRGQGLPASVADHSWRQSAAARTAILILAVGVLAPLAAVVGFVLVGAWEARREIARARGVVELMRVAGAEEGYVAGLVRNRVAALCLTCALWAGVLGMIGAAAASRMGLASALGGLVRADLVTPWPLLLVLAWLAGALGAWLGARGRLRAAE
jgi:cell division transport system permease protein